MSSSVVLEPNLKRGNLWLHSWLGLLLGWLCYLIFFTGTLSFYRDELVLWQAPELHVSGNRQQLDTVFNYLEIYASNAKTWTVNLPDGRNSSVVAFWNTPGVKKGDTNYRNRVHFNPTTGAVLEPRESRLFDFIYRLHFELYGVPREFGRWVVGIAALGMLVAIISGVIIHKRIFKDLFKFQPQKKIRSWLDFHNISAVLALPFHIAITYSGLMLLMFMLMPWGVETALDGDEQALRDFRGGKLGFSEYSQPQENHIRLNLERSLGDALYSLLNDERSREIWRAGIDRVQVINPSSNDPKVVLWGQGAQTLLNRARPTRWYFDLKSGVLTKVETTKVDDNINVQIYNVMTAVHLQRYAQPFQRGLFFFSGLLGTLMVGTGLHIWLKKRPIKNSTTKAIRFGLLIAKGLNIAFLVGLPGATAMAMWLNRLVPADVEARALIEIQGFFIFWLMTFLYGLFREYGKALAESLLLIGVMLLSLIIYNLNFVYSDIAAVGTWLNAPTIVQMIDLSILLIAISLLFFGYRAFNCIYPNAERRRENQHGNTGGVKSDANG